MADEKVNMGPEENKPPETLSPPGQGNLPPLEENNAPAVSGEDKAAPDHVEPDPPSADKHTQRTVLPGMGEDTPAPSGKVINLSDIQAADKGGKEASTTAPEKKAPEADQPKKRRGRPPKEQAAVSAGKKEKAAEPRTGRPSKVDKAAREEAPPAVRDKVSRGNPLVWVMYVLANRDIELSCDAWVIRMMGEKNRSSYALMLIKMEEKRSGMSALYSHFGKNAISERIEAIMKFKKTSILACTLALALIAGATTAFAATNSDATADTSKEKLFGQLSATDDNVKSDGTVAVQKVDQSPFAEVDQESNNSGNDATAEQDGIANFPTQGTKTSIAAKSSIYYNFGTGANNTFYEADTVIEFSIQCVYADIPVQVSLVTADKTEVISSQVVESNEVTPISFTIPEDGDYLICITNESASRTQEYSHMIAR